MCNTDFEGLYKDKDYILQSFKNDDDVIIIKKSNYELKVLSIQKYFVKINKICYFEKRIQI